MSQSFADIQPTDLISSSLGPIENRDEAAASWFAGTGFPTDGLLLGQPCYRTDQKKLYQLTQVSPAIWTLIVDLNGTQITKEAADALYAAIDHLHDGRYSLIGHLHDSRYSLTTHSHNPDADTTALAQLEGTGIAERYGANAWRLAAAGTTGKAVLASADPATARTALGVKEAGTKTVAEVLAAISGYVKADGTVALTGELQAQAGVQTAAAGGATTGYQIAGGVDLAALFLASVAGGSAGASANCVAGLAVSTAGGVRTLVVQTLPDQTDCVSNCDCACGG